MNFIPLVKRVLIQRTEESNTTASGIIIPDTAKEKPFHGKVVAVSSEVDTLAVNDTVVFSKYSGAELTIEGSTYLVLEVDDILGKMK
jgi:chaperonin GroES